MTMEHNQITENTESQFIICPQCNASHFTIDDDGIGTCDYCGATVVIPKKQVEVKVVERKVYAGTMDFSKDSDDNRINANCDDYDILCKDSVLKAFKKLLPLWIFAWLSIILAFASFCIILANDLPYFQQDVAISLGIASLSTAVPLPLAANISNILMARHFFFSECAGTSDLKSIPKKTKKNISKVWRNRLEYLLPAEHTFGKHNGLQAGQLVLFLFYFITLMLTMMSFGLSIVG